ncbi:hypothetical protein [Chondromyces apiculatus]|uniref:Uncharacterized protein n=1 Tax=Chondromyces apiculatus DSM 436 TaxID=1192034 RepID=A0A017STJ6_9BACT|nr:hypothetical protein [Chondromyces apiculatus]EYF00299.1 Hypothetical protein CAP_0951 [Chondromyces apiculatus DSM 436]
MPQRRVPPPDFRYVWLGPAPGRGKLGLAAGTLGFVGASTALWATNHPLPALASGLLGVALALGSARTGKRLPLQRGAREVSMAIVPWGILVTPDTEPRVLRWPAVHRVTVDLAHTLQGGTPTIVASLVTIHTEREILAGWSPGAVDLARLVANLPEYAAEASRPVAADLEGTTPLGDGITEPIAADLLHTADLLCSTSRGAERLLLPHGDYRTSARRIAVPETLSLLRRALTDSAPSPAIPADPRPLAAILAAMLDARPLLPELLALATSPHPVVAAFANASAVRLGAPPNQAGALDEIAAFLCEEDLQLTQRWIAEPPLHP